jgi:hypothetical protein
VASKTSHLTCKLLILKGASRGYDEFFLSQGAIFLNRVLYNMFTDKISQSHTDTTLNPYFAQNSQSYRGVEFISHDKKVYIFLMRFLITRLPEITVYFLNALAKLRKETISFVTPVCLSVRPHGTTRLPPYKYSWNLVFECFSKICRDSSSLFKIRQELQALCANTNVHVWSYRSKLFFEWEFF